MRAGSSGERCARVSIVPCEQYDRDLVREAVRRALAPLGGAQAFARPGDRVLLKPNLLRAAAPDEAVTTHPAVIEAAALEFRDAGATVAVGDSPGGILERTGYILGKTGVGSLCERLGIEIAGFDAGGSRPVPARDAPVASIPLARAVLDADVVVSLPKLKTHGLTELTGAVKNLYGCIPGFVKAEYHKRAPHVDDFARVACAVAEAVAPALSIVDGIAAMDGDGPSAGEPFACGRILAGEDPAAIDRVIYEIVGFDAGRAPFLAECARRGWGTTALDAIETIGLPLDEARVGGFRHPTEVRILRLIPRPVLRALAPLIGRLIWIKPRIDPAACTDCGTCERSCPTGSIVRDERGRRTVRRRTCISCLCCQEVCPFHAIDLESSAVARLFVRPPGREDGTGMADRTATRGSERTTGP
ncbi:MAG: DUF362 domain-containing protein [Planctomycetes bacterium]|nr:DUF362 domain-containing protein [Planctomycetota bacterium]